MREGRKFIALQVLLGATPQSTMVKSKNIHEILPAYEILRSLLRSNGGAQLDHMACMAGNVTPWKIYLLIM